MADRLTVIFDILKVLFCYINSSFILEGDTRGGFTIFYPDDGLDTGDILLTRFIFTLNQPVYYSMFYSMFYSMTKVKTM